MPQSGTAESQGNSTVTILNPQTGVPSAQPTSHPRSRAHPRQYLSCPGLNSHRHGHDVGGPLPRWLSVLGHRPGRPCVPPLGHVLERPRPKPVPLSDGGGSSAAAPARAREASAPRCSQAVAHGPRAPAPLVFLIFFPEVRGTASPVTPGAEGLPWVSHDRQQGQQRPPRRQTSPTCLSALGGRRGRLRLPPLPAPRGPSRSFYSRFSGRGCDLGGPLSHVSEGQGSGASQGLIPFGQRGSRDRGPFMPKPRKPQAHGDALVTAVWKVTRTVCGGHVATSHVCLPPALRWRGSHSPRALVAVAPPTLTSRPSPVLWPAPPLSQTSLPHGPARGFVTTAHGEASRSPHPRAERPRIPGLAAKASASETRGARRWASRLRCIPVTRPGWETAFGAQGFRGIRVLVSGPICQVSKSSPAQQPATAVSHPSPVRARAAGARDGAASLPRHPPAP